MHKPAKFRETMNALRCVKLRLFTALTLGWFLVPWAQAAEAPTAQEVLQSVRQSQASQQETLKGRLRTGGKSTPFLLSMQGSTVRYEFLEPPSTSLVLRLGEDGSRLTEVTKAGAQPIAGPRYSDLVRDTDISYEDLSLRFLYWPKATLEGDAVLQLRGCWVVRVQAPAGAGSQYGTVKLWVDKESSALMQAEAFDPQGKFARRFKVISGQKIAGAWYLKQMRIEAPARGERKDAVPTYLEVEGLVR